MSKIGHRNQGSFASSSGAVSVRCTPHRLTEVGKFVVVPSGVGAETAVRRRLGDACAQ
jgi:hypothetical protein